MTSQRDATHDNAARHMTLYSANVVELSSVLLNLSRLQKQRHSTCESTYDIQHVVQTRHTAIRHRDIPVFSCRVLGRIDEYRAALSCIESHVASSVVRRTQVATRDIEFGTNRILQ